MSDNYETFLHRWFEEVWNKGREDAIDEMFAEDGIANGITDAEGNALRGTEQFKLFFRNFRSSLDDLQVTVEDTVTEGNKIAARCTVRGKHTGEGIGVSPTNQTVEFTGLTIVKLENGKIVEAWNEFDFMKMFSQVGALTLKLK